MLLNTPRPPQILWNHWLCFLLVIGLLTSEWLLRKRKTPVIVRGRSGLRLYGALPFSTRG